MFLHELWDRQSTLLPLDIRPGDLYPSCYWHLMVITEDLLKLVHSRTYFPQWYWHLVVATKISTVGNRTVCILLECCLVSLSFHRELQYSTLVAVIHWIKCNCNLFHKRQRNVVEIVNVVHDVKQLILFPEFLFLDLHVFQAFGFISREL